MPDAAERNKRCRDQQTDRTEQDREEDALYPVVARLMGAPAATATIARDHVEVGLLTDEEATVMFAAMEEAAGAAKAAAHSQSAGPSRKLTSHASRPGRPARLLVDSLGLEGRHGESDEPYSAAATARNTLRSGRFLKRLGLLRAWPVGVLSSALIRSIEAQGPARKRALPGIAPPNAVSTRPGFRVGRP